MSNFEASEPGLARVTPPTGARKVVSDVGFGKLWKGSANGLRGAPGALGLSLSPWSPLEPRAIGTLLLYH